MTKEQAKERVARGAAFLDEHRPDWFKHIDLGSLKLSSPCFCVLGQLYGNFWQACELHGWLEGRATMNAVMKPENMAYQYGFGGSCREPAWAGLTPHSLSTYEMFQEAWIDAINDRLSPIVKWQHRQEVTA